MAYMATNRGTLEPSHAHSSSISHRSNRLQSKECQEFARTEEKRCQRKPSSNSRAYHRELTG